VVSGPAQGEAGEVGFLSIASLVTGASTTIDVQSRGSQFNTYLPAIDYFGIALVGLDQFDTDSTNDSASAPLDTAHLSGLTVTGAVTPRSLGSSSGETVTFTVATIGEGTATNVRLALAGSIPSGAVQGVRASQGTAPSPGDFAPGWAPFASLGMLGPGVSATVSVDLAAAIPSSFALTATPSSDFRLLGPALAMPVASTVADLSVSAVTSPGVVRVGQDAAFALTVANRSANPATGAYLVLDLSALTNVRFASGQVPVNPIPGRPGFYLATLGTLAPGSTAPIALQTTATRTGLLPAIAVAGLDQSDSNPTDNLAFAAVEVIPTVQVAAIEPRVRGDQVTAVRLFFDVPLVKNKAENLKNYHLSTTVKPVGRNGTKFINVPVRLQSAHYDRDPSALLIRLANPLPRLGPPITLVIGGSGSVGLTGQGASPLIANPITVTIDTPAKRRPR